MEILQTPILEAFTNNASSLKSKILSISRTNLLFLPVLEINEVFDAATAMNSSGYFGVAVDQDTEIYVGPVADATKTNSGENFGGYVNGATLAGGVYIRVDQGLDTTEISADNLLDADLLETQYIVEMDNRFASLVSSDGTQAAAVSFIDDDNIASYYLSLGTDPKFITQNDQGAAGNSTQVIAGPRGTILQFKLNASVDLNSSSFLFTELGSTFSPGTPVYYYIDSNIRVTGATTGYRIDIPVRFVKFKSSS